MDVRVFRSRRIWLCNPQGMKFGIGFLITGIMLAFFVLLSGSRFSPELMRIVNYVLAGVFFFSGLLIVRCKCNDPDDIHSFALTDKGEIYHIRIAIPAVTIPLTSLFDMLGVQDQSGKRTTYSDCIRLACQNDFESRVRGALLNEANGGHLGWMQDNNPYSASTNILKMKDPVIEKITIAGAVIRYRTEDRDIIRRAKLFRHNKGYKILLNHIKSESGAER